jgi:tetratricopeptide (TPR) repeat protein
LDNAGNDAEAESLHRRALDARERVLGVTHPDTLLSVASLAGLLAARADDEAEPLYRRALEGLQRVHGAEHPHTATCRDGLVKLVHAGAKRATELEATERYEEALGLRRRHVEAEISIKGPEHPDVALTLNALAILLRLMGRPLEAEAHLRRAIEIERRSLPGDSPKHAHRLGNLCTVLVMQGKLDEATSASAQAWTLKRDRHDITSARILFVRIAIGMLMARPITSYVGQLKTLLTDGLLDAGANIIATWNVESFLVSLRPRLTTQEAAFLTALAATLNDRANLRNLAQFAVWQEQLPLPLAATLIPS